MKQPETNKQTRNVLNAIFAKLSFLFSSTFIQALIDEILVRMFFKVQVRFSCTFTALFTHQPTPFDNICFLRSSQAAPSTDLTFQKLFLTPSSHPALYLHTNHPSRASFLPFLSITSYHKPPPLEGVLFWRSSPNTTHIPANPTRASFFSVPPTQHSARISNIESIVFTSFSHLFSLGTPHTTTTLQSVSLFDSPSHSTHNTDQQLSIAYFQPIVSPAHLTNMPSALVQIYLNQYAEVRVRRIQCYPLANKEITGI